MKMSTYDGYIFLIDKRSPLIARDYAILLGKPKLKEIQRIAKKMKLVNVKGKTKRVLMVNIIGKLIRTKITEPIRLNTRVRVSRNNVGFNNDNAGTFGTEEPGLGSEEPGLGSEEPTSPFDPPEPLGNNNNNNRKRREANLEVKNAQNRLENIEKSRQLENIQNSRNKQIENIKKLGNAKKQGNLKPKIPYPLSRSTPININRKKREANLAVQHAQNRNDKTKQSQQLENIQKSRNKRLGNIRKPTNNLPSVPNDPLSLPSNKPCILIRGKSTCTRNQRDQLSELKRNLAELRKKI